MTSLLEIKNLKTYFITEEEEVPAVDGVSFSIKEGETLCVVGESGSGKSITSLSILQLVPEPHGKIVDGEIVYKGTNLVDLSENEIRKIRGNDISMIFQEPMTSLNPVFTVGDQITESLMLHEKLSKEAALEKAVELLNLVGIPVPEKRVSEYPHQLSGGMRQRVMIAMALACNPDLLIADEPTTALDVTIQAQILELIKDLQQEFGMSVIMITHDLGVVAETCDYVAVMYGGQIVEFQDIKSLFKRPKHPYTVGLMKSIPRHDTDVDELEPIRGNVPSAANMPIGCRFAPRCPFATELCHTEPPSLEVQSEGGEVRCWIYTDRWDGNPEVDIYESETTS